MCYSAQVSFTTGCYLLLAGLWSLKHARKPRMRLFAAMPLIFAAQQVIEGFMWLNIGQAWDLASLYLPYFYLFFAFFVWPVFIPISMYLLEHNPVRKRYILMCVPVGSFVSCVLFGYVLFYGVTASLLTCHIYYNLQIPDTIRAIFTVLYLSVTIIPFLCSSIRFMPLFGLLLFGSYGISYIFYYTHILSVWCFFAALLSGCVCVIIHRLEKK